MRNMMLNSSVYVFGNLGSGYTQYPNDYARKIFNRFYELSSAQTQIAIHREGHLMYYGYIRKLDIAGQYIGFCTLINDVMFTCPTKLFAVFENVVYKLVAGKKILQLSDNGNIVSTHARLSDSQQELKQIEAQIFREVSSVPQKKLLPVSYAVSRNESLSFVEGYKDRDIAEASYKYGFTMVLKNENYDSAMLKSYRDLHDKEKRNLAKGNEKLRTTAKKRIPNSISDRILITQRNPFQPRQTLKSLRRLSNPPSPKHNKKGNTNLFLKATSHTSWKNILTYAFIALLIAGAYFALKYGLQYWER